jgi:pimeloyl-ACP methyl ester carboxylesterase
LAVDHPDRVEKLVVMHAPGFLHARARAMQVGLAVAPLRAGFRRHLLRNGHAFVRKNVHYHKPLLSAEEIIEYATLFESREGVDSFIRILRDCLAPRELKDFHQRMRATPLTMPTLLVWAREDALVSPAFGPRYQALMPGSELVWMEDTSHFMQVDAPEKTVEILHRFLE